MKTTWESIPNKKLNGKKRVRKFHNLPLSAYRATDWCDYVRKLYSEIYNGLKYEGYPAFYGSHSSYLVNRIYKIVFSELKWSSKDFANFIRFDMVEVKKKGLKYAIPLIDTGKGEVMLRGYDVELRNNRESNHFEKITYLPHLPLITKDHADLFEVMKETVDDPLKGMYHFGLPLYHKHYQITKDISFNEARLFVRERFLDIAEEYKDREDILVKIFYGISKNSILWGPYIWPKGLKEVGGTEAGFILNWYSEFKAFWKYFKAEEQDFWRDPQISKELKIIPHVKKIFQIDLDRLSKSSES